MAEKNLLLPELLRRQKLMVTADQVRQLNWLGEELVRWNRSRNLTAITAWDQVVEKHLVDSLLLMPHVPATGRLLDIGSGAGFPSLPLKIVRPELEVVAVDAVAKKVFFQRHVVRVLNLRQYAAVHGRLGASCSELALGASFDLATARAVAGLEHLTELAGPLLRSEGRLLAMKGPEGPGELDACRENLAAGGWRWRSEWSELPITGAARCLLILTKE